VKYKLLSGFIIILLLATVFSLSAARAFDQPLYPRTHQHLVYVEKLKPELTNGFSSHLPIISIDMKDEQPQVIRVVYENGVRDYVSPDVPGTVTVFDNPAVYNSLDDNPVLQIASNINYRGNSSMLHDKKNFKLSFVNEDGSENKEYGLLGMEPHDEWALHGPFLDRSLIRNYFCMNIAGQVLPYTPDVRFCELFVNGEYRGLYLAMETIAKAEGRVDLTTYRQGDANTSFLVKLDWYSDNSKNINPFIQYTKMISSKTGHQILYPSTLLTPDLERAIEQTMSDDEKALYSFDFKDKKFGYPSFYNTQSFIDYAIINEFFQNYDAATLSAYFYQDLGGKFSIGPVWDFNSAFDNFRQPTEDFKVVFDDRYEMLMKDEVFVDRLIGRYQQLRKTVLNEDYLMKYIDDTVGFLGSAVDRNFEVWNNTFDYDKMPSEIRIQYEYRNPKNYTEAVEMIKDYIRKRGSFLDAHIDVLKQYCHESAIKKFLH